MDNEIDFNLLNTRQVAAMLGIAEQTLKTWRMFGKGPQPVKHGPRYVRYRRQDVMEWIERNIIKAAN